MSCMQNTFSVASDGSTSGMCTVSLGVNIPTCA